MPSLSSQWKKALGAWNDSQSSASPGTRFGLMFDPTAYALDLFGKGDKYRDFINKTGDQANKTISSALGTDNSNGWVGNKPASTIGLLAAGYFGGGAALSGMGGSSAGGGSMFGSGSGTGVGSPLGVFSNGGKAGMQGIGGGNAGVLAANHGIPGGAGMGTYGAAPGINGLGGWQEWMKLGQGMQGGIPGGMPGMPGQQQQQPRSGPKPYLYRGQIVWM